jgi:hypothetical protein
MSYYRLYFVADSGHYYKVIELHSESDEAAKQQAVQYMDGCALELWCDDACLKKFPKLRNGAEASTGTSR